MATYYYHYCLLLLCIACAAQEFHGHCYDSYYVRASPGRIANVITVDPTPGDLQAALNPNVSMPLHTCNLYCGMTLSWEWSRSLIVSGQHSWTTLHATVFEQRRDYEPTRDFFSDLCPTFDSYLIVHG